jgi:hypothetical protein
VSLTIETIMQNNSIFGNLNDKQRYTLLFLQKEASVGKKLLDIKASFIVKDIGFFEIMSQITDEFIIELCETGVKIDFDDHVKMMAVSATFKNGISIGPEEKTPLRRIVNLKEFLEFRRPERGMSFYEILFTSNQIIVQHFNLDTSTYLFHRLLPDIFLPRSEIDKMIGFEKAEEISSYRRFYETIYENYGFKITLDEQHDLMRIRKQFDECLKKIEQDANSIYNAELMERSRDSDIVGEINQSKENFVKYELYRFVQSRKLTQ